MNEPITAALELAGIELKFPKHKEKFDETVITAIPGFDITKVYGGETSVYDIEKQDFIFTASTEECTAKNIITDRECTLDDGTYLYTFKLSRDPLNDLTGWSLLYLDLTNKINV